MADEEGGSSVLLSTACWLPTELVDPDRSNSDGASTDLRRALREEEEDGPGPSARGGVGGVTEDGPNTSISTLDEAARSLGEGPDGGIGT